MSDNLKADEKSEGSWLTHMLRICMITLGSSNWMLLMCLWLILGFLSYLEVFELRRQYLDGNHIFRLVCVSFHLLLYCT